MPNVIQIPLGPVNPRALAILGAMLFEETAFKLNALGHQQNNPGDLRTWGTVPIQNHFAKFDNMTDGVLALYKDILANVGQTLRTFVFKFAPPSDGNNSAAYLAFVSGWTEIAPDDVI